MLVCWLFTERDPSAGGRRPHVHVSRLRQTHEIPPSHGRARDHGAHGCQEARVPLRQGVQVQERAQEPLQIGAYEHY